MATSPVDQQPDASPPCLFAEITQHICEASKSKIPGRPPRVNCFPLPRILKICQGKPATEITKEVDINHDGRIHIPPSSQGSSIIGRPWRDVVRYDIAEVERQDAEECARVFPESVRENSPSGTNA